MPKHDPLKEAKIIRATYDDFVAHGSKQAWKDTAKKLGDTESNLQGKVRLLSVRSNKLLDAMYKGLLTPSDVRNMANVTNKDITRGPGSKIWKSFLNGHIGKIKLRTELNKIQKTRTGSKMGRGPTRPIILDKLTHKWAILFIRRFMRKVSQGFSPPTAIMFVLSKYGAPPNHKQNMFSSRRM